MILKLHLPKAILASSRLLHLGNQSGAGLTPMQVLKLVYISHGWMLGLHQRPLFEEDVEAPATIGRAAGQESPPCCSKGIWRRRQDNDKRDASTATGYGFSEYGPSQQQSWQSALWRRGIS